MCLRRRVGRRVTGWDRVEILRYPGLVPYLVQFNIEVISIVNFLKFHRGGCSFFQT